VVPSSLEREGLQAAFVVGGGYKYCQLGEGNCFLRIPEQCNMRPVITGWFSEFDSLAVASAGSEVSYGEGPARFAGSTYDPTSHYRAAAVLDFFDEHGLTPELLREVSRHQVGLLVRLFDELDADPKLIARDGSVGLDGIGGFLALHSPRAGELCRLLKERGVFTDYRGDTLRLGPAPYLSDRQLTLAVDALREVVRSL
jgi:kynureninase